jgi:hypothetical protein
MADSSFNDFEKTQVEPDFNESSIDPVGVASTSNLENLINTNKYYNNNSSFGDSFLIDTVFYHDESQQKDIKRRASSKKSQQRYFGCCQLFKKFKKLVKTRMAFKPEVPDDPRMFSTSNKRIILACLACGSSLNGFCSTVYVSKIATAIYFLKLINKNLLFFVTSSFRVFQISGWN